MRQSYSGNIRRAAGEAVWSPRWPNTAASVLGGRALLPVVGAPHNKEPRWWRVELAPVSLSWDGWLTAAAGPSAAPQSGEALVQLDLGTGWRPPVIASWPSRGAVTYVFAPQVIVSVLPMVERVALAVDGPYYAAQITEVESPGAADPLEFQSRVMTVTNVAPELDRTLAVPAYASVMRLDFYRTESYAVEDPVRVLGRGPAADPAGVFVDAPASWQFPATSGLPPMLPRQDSGFRWRIPPWIASVVLEIGPNIGDLDVWATFELGAAP